MIKHACILLLLLGIGCCRPTPLAKKGVDPSGESTKVRWALLTLQQKRQILHQDDTDGKGLFDRVLREEAGWARLAEQAGVGDAPEFRARLEEARHRLLFEEFLRRKIARDLLTEAEVRLYYEKHQMDFFVPEEVGAAHILVTPKREEIPPNAAGDDAAGDAAAREKIERLRARITGGEDFAQTARQWSEDRTAPEGGRLGWFKRGTMDKAFEEAAFGTPPGAVSPVVRTPFGYHLIHISARRGGYTLPLEEVRREIEDRLGLAKQAEVEALKQRLYSEMKEVCLAR